MRIDSSLFFAFYIILMLSPSNTAQPFKSYSTANISTTWTTDSWDVFITRTNGSQIVCGFLSEGDGTSYIFAIVANYDVVWAANRNYPVRKNAILNFTATGDLVLKDVDGSIVWTTNTAGKSVAGMNLTDTGNLVLFDYQNSVVWQSFDHPTDCLLSGQKLYEGQKLISGVSLRNSSEGMYSLQVTDKGLFGYVESNPPQAYFSWLPYGKDTNKGRRYIRFLNGSLSLFIHPSEPSDPGSILLWFLDTVVILWFAEEVPFARLINNVVVPRKIILD